MWYFEVNGQTVATKCTKPCHPVYQTGLEDDYEVQFTRQALQMAMKCNMFTTQALQMTLKCRQNVHWTSFAEGYEVYVYYTGFAEGYEV